MFCVNCGTECADGSNFCMKCGYNFSAGTVATAAQPVMQQAPVQTPVAGGPPPIIDGRPWVQNSGVVNPYPVPGYDMYSPTFHCRCEYCYFEFDYHTYDLGHRAWYPHGFVYCPRCKKPLRHRLEYEVIKNPVYAQQYNQSAVPVAPVVPAPAVAPAPMAAPAPAVAPASVAAQAPAVVPVPVAAPAPAVAPVPAQAPAAPAETSPASEKSAETAPEAPAQE